jgi:hypothetical protein
MATVMAMLSKETQFINDQKEKRERAANKSGNRMFGLNPSNQ